MGLETITDPKSTWAEHKTQKLAREKLNQEYSAVIRGKESDRRLGIPPPPTSKSQGNKHENKHESNLRD